MELCISPIKKILYIYSEHAHVQERIFFQERNFYPLEKQKVNFSNSECKLREIITYFYPLD